MDADIQNAMFMDFKNPNRFLKWVHMKEEKHKKTFSRKRFKPLFLIYNISKRLDLYDEEIELSKLDDDDCKKPVMTYSLQSSSFYIKDRKDRIITFFIMHNFNRKRFGYNRIEHIDAKKSSQVHIKCVNNFDFGDLLRHLREAKMKEESENTLKTKKLSILLKKMKKERLSVNTSEKDKNNEDSVSSTTRKSEIVFKKRRKFSMMRKNVKNEDGKKKTSSTFLDPDVTNWSTHDVKLWASDIFVGKKFESKFSDICGSYLDENQISGLKILLWEDNQRKDFINSFRKHLHFTERRRLIAELTQMKETRTYDPSMNSITKKVLNMLKYQRGQQFKALDVFKLRKKFGKRSEIRDRIKTILYKQQQNEQKNEIEIRPNLTFNVKVNIVENLTEERKKRMRKFLGLFLEVKDTFKTKTKENEESSTEFGIFHSALTIGNLQLEWVDSEIVIVRPASSEKAILCCDVGKIVIKDGNEFSDYLSKELHKWNTSYSYNNLKRSENVANCQTFVQRILKFIGLDWSLSPKVKKFLDTMKYSGVCDKIFKFDKKFADSFFKERMFLLEETTRKKYYKTREFRPQTHEQLDLFVQCLFRKCPTFERDYNESYMLLKGFDRAFWLQYFKNQQQMMSSDESSQVVSVYRPALRTDDGDKNYRLNGCPFTKRSFRRTKVKEEDKEKEESEGESVKEQQQQHIRMQSFDENYDEKGVFAEF